MKIQRITEGAQTHFVVSDINPMDLEAIQQLEFPQKEGSIVLSYPSNTPHLERIYQNFERFLEEMILQTARIHPVPWQKSLHAFLPMMHGQDFHWFLCGSVALAVRGVEVLPRDIDLVVDAAGAHRLGELLLDFLVQPVQPSPGWIANWFGRAFLHARLEWVGEVVEAADQPEVSDFGLLAAQRLETVHWQGYELQVPPLDLQLQVSERRGLSDRAEKIRRALA